MDEEDAPSLAENSEKNAMAVKKRNEKKSVSKKAAAKKENLETVSRDTDFEEEEPLENDTELTISREDFGGLLVAPSDWTIDSISRQIGRQIDLNPDFQRRGVWNNKAKSKFIESLFLNIPIPQVLLASKPDDKNQFIVLDGKQRLLAINQFLKGVHEDGKPFSLEDLRILTGLNGKTWAQIKNEEVWRDLFMNQTLRAAVLRGWQNEDVLFEIFQRLNSGSVKLSPMELRMSLHPGDFLKFLVRWTEGPRQVHKLLRLNGPDKRMADVELGLRYLGFMNLGDAYAGNLKKFLDDLSLSYNTDFSLPAFKSAVTAQLGEMEAAIACDMEVFGERRACRKWKNGSYDKRFNRAVFDIQITSLSNSKVRAWATKHPSLFEKAFIDLCRTDRDFLESLETTTKSISAVKKRFRSWYSALSKASKLKLSPPFDASSN